MSDLRYLYLYRPKEGGGRQRWKFTVDRNMNILTEEQCRDDGTVGPPAPRPKEADAIEKAVEASPHLKALKARGVEFHLEGNTVHLDKIPPSEILVSQFFTEDLPCPDFPGCEKMRARYLEEKAEISDENGVCKGCDLGQLQSKYRPLVISAIGAEVTRYGTAVPATRKTP